MAKHGGTRARAGRKSKAEELGLVALLDKAFTQSDRENVIQNLVVIAKGDDLKAAVSASTLLLSYAYGKPKESHALTGESGGPIEVIVRHVSRGSAAKD